MGLLSKDAIWQAEDTLIVDVHVPEWNGSVRLRGLSGKERDAFEASSVQQIGNDVRVNKQNFRARLIAACAINEDGTQLFDKGDIIHLGQKSAKALDRLFDECLSLNGMKPEDVKDLTENLDDGQNGNSTSA
jgi:hypothetical protein